VRGVVVDTNVYISALVFGGTPRMVFGLIEGVGYRLYVSRPIMDEVADVLTRRFGWSEEDLRRFLAPLWRRCFIVRPAVVLEICDDPDDDRILECAQTADADFIVTGDEDLLRLKRFGSAEIVRPRDFVDAHVK
jgi:uncharacterized protein